MRRQVEGCRWPRSLLSSVTALTTAALLAGCAGTVPIGAPGSASQAGRPTSSVTGSGSSGSSGPTSGDTSSSPAGPALPTSPQHPELPEGGRKLLPDYRLVGFAGVPGSRAMGRLGIGNLDARAREIVEVGKPYADGRKVLPVLELIATIVQGQPGRDGKYRSRVRSQVVDDYLAAARRVHGILLINIQPGRAGFLDEVHSYARWLEQPDVGVALDPEWSMGPGQVPMKEFGHTTGRTIDSVATYLAGIVKERDLPEKALVFHQLSPSIVSQQSSIHAHSGVVIIKSVDGIGSPSAKESTWRKLTTNLPASVHTGFKLFYEEDRNHGALMTPQQVLALRPQPDYVLYE